MILTRSHSQGEEFHSIPLYDDIIYVSCSELFSAFHNDYINYIIEMKNRDNIESVKKHWSLIREKSFSRIQYCNYFFSFISSHIKNAKMCIFMGYDHVYKLNEFMNNDCLYMHKIPFRNKYSHVNGMIDGLIHASLLKSYLKIEDAHPSKKYIMIYLYDKDKIISTYHRIKLLSQLHYFSRSNPNIENTFVIVVKPDSYEIVEYDEKQIKKIKEMIKFIQHISCDFN